MADASLYNGQPTDTAGLISSTPSISDDSRGGVLVEYVSAKNKQGLVLKVSYGRVLKAKDFVEAKDLGYYVPLLSVTQPAMLLQAKKQATSQ